MKWHDEEGEHEGLSDAELAKDLRDLRGVDKLLREGKITEEQHKAAQNIIRPAEGDEPALGEMWHGNADWHCHKEKKKRGRPRNEDQELT